MSSLIGKSLQGGKYKLDSVLGRGGFGLTFRAQQVYLDQVVVIKTLNESFWSANNLSDLQRQFQDEARRLALCSHPNVVRVSDFFVEDKLPYMVMDYIPGRSLADIVLPGPQSTGPLPVAASLDYIQQIGQALQAVHSRGLLHRDVKPQNIMIHQLTGEAILIDFGIARELSQNPTQTHTTIVSEGYAPIEQYLPKAQRSAATDIYGLAATLYTLLTGEIPVAAILRDRTPLTPLRQLRPDVSEAMAQAIAHGMAIELRDRPQSVGPWLSELTGSRTGLFGRTRRPTAPNANFSELPTQVVAPRGRVQPAVTGSKTVAVPVPTEYGEAYRPDGRLPRPYPDAQPSAQNSPGCSCASVLTILSVAVLGVFAGAGFWLYEQFGGGPPELSLPEITLPEVDLPTTLPQPTDPAESEPTEPTEPADSAEVEEPEPPAEPPAASAQPPQTLASAGPDAQSGSGSGADGGMVAVPGFPPGASEDQIRDRLGSPTQEYSADGYYTSVYSVVPGRATLAYAYEQGSTEVRQSEAAFSPSSDRLVMRTTLMGMLDGRSSQKIEDGLEAVRAGQQDRFDFERKGFTGSIERNANDYIYINVRQ
jgi:serine/threonine-protein kinase